MTYKIESSSIEYDVTKATHLPLSERVLDRLGDILWATDEILDMIRVSGQGRDESTGEVEQSVRHVYDEVNLLMQRLAD
ncbi:MAG: hypothetical protein JWN02_1155 [Acidobacteria bacterium]|nr:hypothetical protein [Acidobacteriota bacterium]